MTQCAWCGFASQNGHEPGCLAGYTVEAPFAATRAPAPEVHALPREAAHAEAPAPCAIGTPGTKGVIAPAPHLYSPGYQDTSREAWESIQSTLPASRLAALRALAERPLTGGEANRALASGEGNPSYHRRLAELVEDGYAIRTGKRECSVSGRAAWEFQITERGRAALRGLAA